MAMIEIPKSEVERELSSCLSRMRDGEELRIDAADSTIAISKARKKTLSEAIRLAKLRNEDVTLDDQFASDLESILVNHAEAGLRNAWQD